MKDDIKRYVGLVLLGVFGVIGVLMFMRYMDQLPELKTKVQVDVESLGAPEFRLKLATGGALESADLRGGPVIVNFWASWCDACKHERKELAELHAVAGERMLGIGTQDEEEKLLEYDRLHPHGYRILLDADGDVAAKFQVAGLPHTFLLGKDGKVLARVAGALKPDDVTELKRLFASAAQ